MKRSEMLKLIESLIDAGREDLDLVIRAENLLCHIEEAGMSPPPTLVELEPYVMIKDESGKEIPMAAEIKNEWEQE